MNAGTEASIVVSYLIADYNYSVVFPLYDAIGDCECGCVKALLDDLMLSVQSTKYRMTEIEAKLRELPHACRITPE